MNLLCMLYVCLITHGYCDHQIIVPDVMMTTSVVDSTFPLSVDSL